jgi:hypothetical protein
MGNYDGPLRRGGAGLKFDSFFEAEHYLPTPLSRQALDLSGANSFDRFFHPLSAEG